MSTEVGREPRGAIIITGRTRPSRPCIGAPTTPPRLRRIPRAVPRTGEAMPLPFTSSCDERTWQGTQGSIQIEDMCKTKCVGRAWSSHSLLGCTRPPKPTHGPRPGSSPDPTLWMFQRLLWKGGWVESSKLLIRSGLSGDQPPRNPHLESPL